MRGPGRQLAAGVVTSTSTSSVRERGRFALAFLTSVPWKEPRELLEGERRGAPGAGRARLDAETFGHLLHQLRARPARELATLTLEEFRALLHGTLVRNASRDHLASRTARRVDVDNPAATAAGAYAFVHLKLPDEIGVPFASRQYTAFRAEGLQSRWCGTVRRSSFR